MKCLLHLCVLPTLLVGCVEIRDKAGNIRMALDPKLLEKIGTAMICSSADFEVARDWAGASEDELLELEGETWWLNAEDVCSYYVDASPADFAHLVAAGMVMEEGEAAMMLEGTNPFVSEFESCPFDTFDWTLGYSDVRSTWVFYVLPKPDAPHYVRLELENTFVRGEDEDWVQVDCTSALVVAPEEIMFVVDE